MINFCENITKFEILYNSFEQMNCKTEIEKYLLHTIYSSNEKSTWKTVVSALKHEKHCNPNNLPFISFLGIFMIK